MRRKQPEMSLHEACRIIHLIQWQYSQGWEIGAKAWNDHHREDSMAVLATWDICSRM